MRLNNAEQAILLTLAYSDIFDFPLTKEEIWKRLISDKKIKREGFEDALTMLIKVSRVARVAQVPRAFYCLIGREKIINKRVKNLSEVEKKLVIAKRSSRYLSFIPSIKFIGLSGGLAIGDVDKEDDIDFFIITKKNSLFVTRFLSIVMLDILNLRRKRNDKSPGGKICLNLLVDEYNLFWSDKMQDLYTAHEIIQIKPLFEKGQIYKKFLITNRWVKKYFINYDLEKNRQSYETASPSYTLLFPLEFLIRKAQEHYMKKHITTEIVSRGFIAFHPKDYRTKTMKLLRSKCKKLGLLTNF